VVAIVFEEEGTTVAMSMVARGTNPHTLPKK